MDLSRRQFLKTSAVVSGATGLALNADRKVLRTLEAAAPAQAESSGEEQIVTVFTPCAGCHQKCVLWVHVVDGRITKTEPAQFPDQPEDNHCCLKGMASARFPYQPDRLKYPVKRVGERGEGKWEQISWDEALDTVAEMLKETRDKYGAKAVFTDHTGSTVSPQNNDVNSGAEAMRFENLFGSTYPDGWYDDTSLLVSNFFTTGQDLDCNDPRGLMHSKLIIICGANPAESAFRDWMHIARAKEAGARVIDIGVLYDPTAAKCDEFIPIRRATDAALALSMLQVIIEAGLHDEDALRRLTIAPLLVRDDDGKLLREADVTSGGSQEKFVAWDATANKPIIVERAQFDQTADAAMTGTFTANGIACRTALQVLIDAINKDYKPEQAAEITGIPAAKIRELALAYANAKPAAIYYNFGLGRYFNGNIATRAQLALGAACGYLGVIGGGVSCGGMSIPGAGGGYLQNYNLGPIHKPTDASVNIMTLYDVLQAIETEKPFPIKMWVNSYRNPFQCCPNPQRWIEKIVPKLDYMVNINVRLDWTAQYADIVLPDCTIFERLTVSGVQDHVILSGPAIEPMFESHPTNWIYSELAKRFDFADQFTSSAEDYVKVALSGDAPELKGITIEKLRENGGIVRANVPTTPYVALSHMNFDTPTGRIEFYAERLLEIDEALPLYKPSLEAPHSDKFPFQYFSCRKKFYIHTFLGDMPILHRYMGEPWVDINPTDAEAKGIVDGDMVEIFNDRGNCTVKALINPMVPPGTVRTNHGPGPQDFVKGHYQMLQLPHATPETFNKAHDMRYQMTQPWWKWGGGQADIIFDCAVDIRKV